jgi:hypothetical protein
MAEFKEIQQDLLYEMLRLSGLADSMNDPECALCHAKLDSGGPLLPPPGANSLDHCIFKCPDCGEFLQCKHCCLARHAMMPLHFLKVFYFQSGFSPGYF